MDRQAVEAILSSDADIVFSNVPIDDHCARLPRLEKQTPPSKSSPTTTTAPSSVRPARETMKEKKARLEKRIQELEALLSAERQEIREQSQSNAPKSTNVTTNLPSTDVLAQLVNLFFSRVPSAQLILDRNVTVQALNLPRDHSDYPAASILHAICAIASLFSENVLPSLQTTQSTHSRVLQGFQHVTALSSMASEKYGLAFGEQQVVFAHAAMEAAHQSGNLAYESMQANMLLSWFYFATNSSARALCASADSLRTSTLLGLTRSGTQPLKLPWAATLPLGPLNEQSRVEIERQRRFWWIAYATDRWQTANTSWPTLLDDEDITQFLPLPLTPTIAVPPKSRQQISTRGMFTTHLAGQTDSFVLFVKGAIILSLVKTFNLRWDAPYRHSPDGRPDARSTAPFQDIDRLLVEFEANMRTFQFLGARGVDQHMLLARATPYVATILLHEQYAQPIDVHCTSTTRVVDSARQIWVLMQELSRAEVDTSQMDPIFSIVLAVGCRVFLRVIEVKLSEGRIDEARMFKPEAELLRFGLQAMGRRFPLAANQASTLDNVIRSRLGRRYEQIGQSYVTSHLQEARS